MKVGKAGAPAPADAIKDATQIDWDRVDQLEAEQRNALMLMLDSWDAGMTAMEAATRAWAEATGNWEFHRRFQGCWREAYGADYPAKINGFGP